MPDAHNEIDRIEAAAEAFGDAKVHEMALEDARAWVKDQAIQRIMARDNLAVTRAEKIVETDMEYMKHRALQFVAIRNTIRCEAAYRAALLNAQLAVDLALPEEQLTDRRQHSVGDFRMGVDRNIGLVE